MNLVSYHNNVKFAFVTAVSVIIGTTYWSFHNINTLSIDHYATDIKVHLSLNS
jgi:hypothetical protein